MTVLVLEDIAQVQEARRAMRAHKVSFVNPLAEVLRKLERLGWYHGILIGDTLKSWDVWKTVQFLEQHVPRSACVLDIGAFQSEVVCCLHRLGYSRLTAIDLNPNIAQMPAANVVRYEVADFMHTSYATESFQAITAVSVIEHGLQQTALLAEIDRLLTPDGYFIASFDYWPEKLDTTGIDIFGMSWTIFSQADVLDFIAEASTHGLEPVGQVQLETQTPVINMFGMRYTFAWLVLQKRSAREDIGHP